jgi:xylose isomerase
MSIFAPFAPIRHEGPDSRNPLSYRHYDPERLVMGRRMADHLRWAVCYWHSFAWPGADIFGAGTFNRPWAPGQPVTAERAALKMAAAFDLFTCLGAPFFTFHDVDAMPDHDGAADYVAKLAGTVDALEGHMARTGVKLLWGTANLFGHPRYAAGAATSPDPDIFAWAALQVRSMLEATQRLDGANYVLWGGREGYDTLLNTDLAQEMDQLGRFLTMVVEHKHRIGFAGTILIEPKPHEPMKHHYDRDVATVHGFLLRHGLDKEIKVNIEANHATLAGHSFEHEVAMATALGILGSIDINRGDPQNGWDTDQFPSNAQDLVPVMLQLLKTDGLGSGGFNFDAKVRRQSVEPVDLLHAHIGGVDALARALLAAERLILDGDFAAALAGRYAGWQGALGQDIMAGRISLAQAADHALATGSDPRPASGGQERLENLVSRSL